MPSLLKRPLCFINMTDEWLVSRAAFLGVQPGRAPALRWPMAQCLGAKSLAGSFQGGSEGWSEGNVRHGTLGPGA